MTHDDQISSRILDDLADAQEHLAAAEKVMRALDAALVHDDPTATYAAHTTYREKYPLTGDDDA